MPQKIRFAIIGPQDSQNTADLCEEVHSKNHTSTTYSINEISIDTQSFGQSPFFSHDIYIFRGYNNSINFAHILANTLNRLGKIVFDDILPRAVVRTKIQEIILLHTQEIPTPRTYYAQDTSQWKELLKDAPLPLVIKPINGQKGQDIVKISDIVDVLDYFNKNPKGFIAQEFIETDGDLRVFIVGQKILGAIKRICPKNDFRSNASLGAKTEIHQLTQEESSLALRAHKCIGYDISGVDIILDEHNKPRILEVNHTPQWQAFKKTTKVNPAEEIINFALQQYEKKNRVL